MGKSIAARIRSALAPLEYISPSQWPRFLAYRRRLGRKETKFHVKGIPVPLICRAGTTDAITLECVFGMRSHLPERPLRRNAVILDLGANVGYASAHFAALYPDARIVAVELDSENAAVARRNLEHCRCEVVNAAIWTTDGTIEWGGGAEDAFAVKEGGAKSASAVTLDTLLNDRGIERVDFVKMDVEGAEWPLLNSPRWLDRIDSIALEVHHKAWMKPLMTILTENGFEAGQSQRDPTRLVGYRASSN